MAYIVEFYVEGLAGKDKGFGHKLNRDANLFFGLNGTGKTSLLNIFHSAFENDATLLSRVAFSKAYVLIHSDHYNKDFACTLDRSVPNQSSELQLSLEDAGKVLTVAEYTRLTHRALSQPTEAWKIEPAMPKDTTGFHNQFLPISRLLTGLSENHDMLSIDSSSYEKLFADGLMLHWNDFFGKIQSEVRSIQQNGIAKILNEIIMTEATGASSQNLNWETAYERTFAFLQRQSNTMPMLPKEAFEKRFNENPALQKVVELIEDIEGSIARALEPKTKLQGLITRLFSGNKSLILKDTSIELKSKNDSTLSLESLSSGEKQLLRILFDALRTDISSLIIDEPELSLHIDWQRKLVSSIAELNPGLQLIAATHSPEILAEVDDSKIFKIPA